MKLYAVGGAVRDHLLGRHSKDLDFAVEAESFETMVQELIETGLRPWQMHPEFVTVRGKMPTNCLGSFGGLLRGMGPFIDADFTLCRKEGMYHDNRHPSTVTPAGIYTDLSRRDFTMNAIAVTEDGQFIDPHEGRKDVASRVIMCVGNPIDRFEEDPLRILRAIRFAAELEFWIAGCVETAMQDREVLKKLALLPVERIVNELQRAMKVDWAGTMFRLTLGMPEVTHILADSHPRLWFKPTTEIR